MAPSEADVSSSDGEYQGSQAYAAITGSSESVNRNTGTVDFNKSLVSLRGVVNSIGLNLNVSYSQGLQGAFGLPGNWTFGIPFLIPGKSVTTQGKTYVIDFTWSDSKGYQSGLKYINNHAIKFKRIMPSQPLPFDQKGTYGWEFRMIDGAYDYYDDAGKILMHADRFGNYILYHYADNQAGPLACRLDFIQDSWGQKVVFSYQPGSSIRVKSPDQGETEITLGTRGIASIKDACGYVTAFSYDQQSEVDVLRTIRYSSSLQVKFNYTSIKYLDLQGSTKSRPAVQDHIHLDKTGATLSHTQYKFGDSTSSTYTGFASGYRFGGATDALMQSNNQLYKYDTLIIDLSPTDLTRLSATRIVYNYLHLPVQELHYKIDANSGAFLNSYQAKYAYSTSDYSRNTNYASPIEVEQLHWRADAYHGLRKVKTKYDEFANLTESREERWDSTSQSYAPFATTQNQYVTTSWHGSTLIEAIFTDESCGLQRKVNHVLSNDEKTVASSRTTYKATTAADYLPWKTKTYEHDTQGRATRETVAWTDSSHVLPGSVASFSTQLSYSYDLQGINTIVTTDALGNQLTSKYNTTISHGPLVSKTLPLGDTESFEYDRLGRCIKHVDPFGRVLTTTYIIGAEENSESTLDWQGYLQKTVLDVKGRVIETLDNGDPTPGQVSATPSRLLTRSTYDSLSRITKQEDAFRLLTLYGPFDGLGRILSSTSPEGNITTHVYDDAELTTQQFVNGQVTLSTQLDAGGRTIRRTEHPDSSDTTATYVRTTEIAYDASNNITDSKVWQQPKDGGNATLLTKSRRSYDSDNQLTQYEGQGLSDLGTAHYDATLHKIRRDIFGREYIRTKDTTYHDGTKFTWSSAVNIYDECNQLVAYRNRLAQEEKHSYDGNGNLVSTTRFDGSRVDYENDLLGRATKISMADTTYNTAYGKQSNKVSSRDTASRMLKYEYTLDGSAKSVEYPGGSKQTYGLDRFGRVTSNVDNLGTARHVDYDDLDRVSAYHLGQDTCSLIYGEACHVKGQKIGETITGGRNLAKTFGYDGFGRLGQFIVRDSNDGKTMLKANYRFDSRGRLKETQLRSEKSPTNLEYNYTRGFTYDGFGQLREDTCTFTPTGNTTKVEYKYDGNSNIISVITGGTTETRTYNAIDQRADPGFKYDINGRLLQDSRGLLYIYDTNDRLLGVRSQAADTKYEYYPDGAMSRHIANDKISEFYYDGGCVNASKTNENNTDTKTSFLLQPGHRILSTEVQTARTTHYIDNRGSIVIEADSVSEKASFYDAYGAVSENLSANEFNFGFQQEFTDKPSGGLLYLRSRFYSTQLGSFITMDGAQKDNRYSYCAGDPINLIDPTGRSAVAFAAGFGAGTAATLIVAGVATAIFAPEALLPIMAIGAISGAAGSVVGNVVSTKIDGDDYTLRQAGIDIASGAIGGLAGAGLGALGGKGAAMLALSRGWSEVALQNFAVVSAGVIGGAGGAVASSLTSEVLSGGSISGSDLALNALVGGVAGGLGGAWAMKKSPGAPQRSLAKAMRPYTHDNGRMLLFHNEADYRECIRLHNESPGGNGAYRTHGKRTGEVILDRSILVHGNDEGVVGPFINGHNRTMKIETFAKYLADYGWSSAADGESGVKFLSCKGGFLNGNAQVLADGLQRPVWGTTRDIGVFESGGGWNEFLPR